MYKYSLKKIKKSFAKGVDFCVVMVYNEYSERQKKTHKEDKKMLEKIIAMLGKIHEEDGWYRVKADKNYIGLTINDFDGFDDEWAEEEHEFEDLEAVEEVLEWLEENADYQEGDLYISYHFGEIEVVVGYTSFDI
jgi:hypothetical protein